MNDTVIPASAWQDDEDKLLSALAREGTGGGSQEVRWEIVARTSGLLPAQIKAGRLEAEGIPARAWAESAGVAIGLTVGLLGTGFVSVPEDVAEQARAILAVEFDEEE